MGRPAALTPLITTVVGVLARKYAGHDCTEDESAQVKRYLRAFPLGSDWGLADRLAEAFPAESEEVASEDPASCPELHDRAAIDRGDAAPARRAER